MSKKYATTFLFTVLDNLDVEPSEIAKELIIWLDKHRQWEIVREYAIERQTKQNKIRQIGSKIEKLLLLDEDNKPDPFAPKPHVRQYL